MEKQTLKNRLVCKLTFTGDGFAENGAGHVAINGYNDKYAPCEAVGFYFYEKIDRIIPVEDKKRIGEAIKDLFNYAVEAGEIDTANVVKNAAELRIGYDDGTTIQ